MTFLATILGGLSRALVGGGWVSRGAIYAPTAALCAYLGFGLTWEALVFGAVSALTLSAGWTKWDDGPYMAFRYGILPMITAFAYLVATHDPLPMAWGMACAFIGFTYGTMLSLFKRVNIDIKGYVIDASRVAEFVVGSVIIGGISFL